MRALQALAALAALGNPTALTALAFVIPMTGCDLIRGGEARGGGGGFEGETVTLAGQMLLVGGLPAAGAHVRLRLKDFPAGETGEPAWDTVAGADGRYSIPKVPEGEYILESFDSLARSILVPVLVQPPADPDSQVAIPPDTLRPVGSIRGRVIPADGGTPALPAGLARIAGLVREAAIDAEGYFLFADLPPGKVDLRISFPSLEAARRVNGVQVQSGDTTDLGTLGFAFPGEEDYASWPHSRKIHLNTTAAGANIQENALDFPLLIRLHAGNFDFGAAYPADGADIRFSKPDGSPLPYEREAWDSAGKKAAFWVRMDTVHGNRSDQYLTLHWGKPDVFAFSDARSVFDSAGGFAGVWHLSKEGPTLDATGRSAPGTQGGTSASPGIAGFSRRFDGQDAVRIPAGAVLEPTAFTLSCWARREGPQVSYAKFFYKGSYEWPYASYTLDMRRAAGALSFKVSSGNKEHIATAEDMVPETTWVHVAATFEPATGTGRLYLNGSLGHSFTGVGPVRYPAGDYPLFIGNESQPGKTGRIFKGRIDEARLSMRVYPQQRLRLEYESQKPDGKLLEFR